MTDTASAGAAMTEPGMTVPAGSGQIGAGRSVALLLWACDPDDPVPSLGEDVSDRGLARARRPGDPDHHAGDSARTADKNLSFSQSAPTETRR